jgi:hypothetical protein
MLTSNHCLRKSRQDQESTKPMALILEREQLTSESDRKRKASRYKLLENNIESTTRNPGNQKSQLNMI